MVTKGMPKASEPAPVNTIDGGTIVSDSKRDVAEALAAGRRILKKRHAVLRELAK